MANQIIEVHSIASAAAGWRRIKDGEPVACFALVTIAAPESLSVTEKMVVPLVAADLLLGLVGNVVDQVDGDVEFTVAVGD